MGFLMQNPLIVGGLVLVIVFAIIIVVSVIISKKRKKEVEELERMFSDGHLGSDDVKIPVEKVRRATRKREKRKKKLQYIPRELPTEPFPDEDKEIIVRPETMESKRKTKPEPRVDREPDKPTEQKRSSRLSAQSFPFRKRSGEAEEVGNQGEPGLFAEAFNEVSDEEQSFAVRRMTRKVPKDTPETETEMNEKKQDPLAKSALKRPEEKKQGEEAQEKKVDAATSRRLYKRSLLKPDSHADSGETGNIPKASLIDTQMFAKDEIAAAADSEKEKTPSRTKRFGGKNWFSK